MDNNTNNVGNNSSVPTGATGNTTNQDLNVVSPESFVSNGVSEEPVITNVVSEEPVITGVQTNNQTSMVESSNVVGGNTSSGTDNPEVVNEKLKKVEVNYTPPSTAKMVFTVFTFFMILGFVIFLPEITTAVNNYKASKGAIDDEVITTGRLECDLKSNTTNLDMSYSRVFKFTDSKLNEAEFVITTRGDITLDEATLNEMADKCKLLKDYTDDMSGVDVDCSHTEGKLTETQRFEYASIDVEELDAAFAEAGGTYPEFKNEQDIDIVEKNMNAAGYSCMRKK